MFSKRKALALFWLLSMPIVLTICRAAGAATAPGTRDVFLDVGKHPAITMLINQSPWYGGFEKVVQLYEKQTGNKMNLDVTPYAGMLEKARNAVRGKESPYDLINIDTQNTVEFYMGGFLAPLKEIDPNFQLDPRVLTYDDCLFWNEKTQWRDARSRGTLRVPRRETDPDRLAQ